MNNSEIIKKELNALKNKEKSIQSQKFFKTGKGEYGEGDIFIGISVPEQRKISRKYYKETSINDIKLLLHSEIHEYRSTAIIILVLKYKQEKDIKIKKQYVDFYLANTDYINNWDLVDSSAYQILGNWTHNKDKTLLYKLAKSGHLWEERISMVSCMYDIKLGIFDTSFEIAKLLLQHEHDLIHKAVGWMLKEIGKIDMESEEVFLKKHYKQMPRTMLRYSIEKFPEEKRQAYLKGKI
jgi:3-methyladenine DNA glycosylase AlkD